MKYFSWTNIGGERGGRTINKNNKKTCFLHIIIEKELKVKWEKRTRKKIKKAITVKKKKHNILSKKLITTIKK